MASGNQLVLRQVLTTRLRGRYRLWYNRVMSTDLSQIVARQMRSLPPEDQQKVVDFVEDLAKPKRMTLMEKIEERLKKLSSETIESLPVDGAENIDHYLYGHAKKTR